MLRSGVIEEEIHVNEVRCDKGCRDSLMIGGQQDQREVAEREYCMER